MGENKGWTKHRVCLHHFRSLVFLQVGLVLILGERFLCRGPLSLDDGWWMSHLRERMELGDLILERFVDYKDGQRSTRSAMRLHT